MQMPGRQYSVATGYRYGFNGKEMDNEVSGNGNKLDFGERIYDSRLGRWLSFDPSKKEYESPFMAFANNPIWILDPTGADTIRISHETTFQHLANGDIKKTVTNTTTVFKAPGDDVIYFQSTINNLDVNGKQRWGKPAIGKSEFHVHGNKITSPYDKKRGASEEWESKPEDSKWFKLGEIMKSYSPDLYNYLAAKDPKTYNNVALAQAFAAYNKLVQNTGNAAATILMIFIPGPKINATAGEYVTVYRTINEAEMASLSSGQFAFGPNGSTMKQFWLNEEAYNTYIKAGGGAFANGYKLEMQIPKSLIGNGKVLDTGTQVDASLFPAGTTNSATVSGQNGLNILNQNVKEIKIIKE